jgi:hypothetical protein
VRGREEGGEGVGVRGMASRLRGHVYGALGGFVGLEDEKCFADEVCTFFPGWESCQHQLLPAGCLVY